MKPTKAYKTSKALYALQAATLTFINYMAKIIVNSRRLKAAGEPELPQSKIDKLNNIVLQLLEYEGEAAVDDLLIMAEKKLKNYEKTQSRKWILDRVSRIAERTSKMRSAVERTYTR